MVHLDFRSLSWALGGTLKLLPCSLSDAASAESKDALGALETLERLLEAPGIRALKLPGFRTARLRSYGFAPVLPRSCSGRGPGGGAELGGGGGKFLYFIIFHNSPACAVARRGSWVVSSIAPSLHLLKNDAIDCSSLQSIECRSSPSQEVRFGGCEPGALQISHPEPQFLLLRSRILWDPMRPRGRVRGGSRPSETIESDHLNTLFLRRSVYFFILSHFLERYRGRKSLRRSEPCSTMRF